MACLDIVKTTHRDYVLGGASSTPVSVRFSDTNVKNVDTEPVAQPFVLRRTRLNLDYFRKYAFMVGCQGCEHIQSSSSLRRNQKQQRRDRIEVELSKTVEGRDTLGRAKDRLDTKTAEMMEKMADAPETAKEVRTEYQGQTEGVQQGQGEIPPEVEPETQPMGDQVDVEFMDAPRAGSEHNPVGPREIDIGIPGRPRREKRRGDPDEMDDESKSRQTKQPEGYLPGEEVAMAGADSPNDSPEMKIRRLDEDMLDSTQEVDKTIMAAAILGVDITNVYSPERVAQPARRFG